MTIDRDEIISIVFFWIVLLLVAILSLAIVLFVAGYIALWLLQHFGVLALMGVQ